MSKKPAKRLRWSKKYVALICAQSCMILFFGSIILITSSPTKSANAQPVGTTPMAKVDSKSLTVTAMAQATATVSAKATVTVTASANATVTVTASANATVTPTVSAKATVTPTAKPTQIPPTPVPVPTNTPLPVIMITPTAAVPTVVVTPTSNVVPPTPTMQPKNVQPTPPTQATSTVAPIVPGDTAAPTNTTGGGGKTSHASLSSMLLPITGIVGMVGVAIAALIGVEMRRRQRSQRRQQTNAAAPYPNTSFSPPPSQPPTQGMNQQYSMQQYANMAGTVVMTPPAVSGMSPVANPYSTEMEVQAQRNGMSPTMRSNEPASPASPPDWMQDLSPSDIFLKKDQIPQDDIQTYMHPQSSAPDLNALNGPTQAYNYPPSSQNQGIEPTGGNFPGGQPGNSGVQSGMKEQIAEQVSRTNISSNSGPQSAKFPENTPPIMPPQSDSFLEAIMRQAQMGIFAMPDKDPGQPPS